MLSAPVDELVEILYDRHAASLFRYAAALTNSTEDAEDAVQEAFAGIVRQGTRIYKVKDLRSYLIRAPRNAAYSLLRSRRRSGSLVEALALDAIAGEVSEDDVVPRLLLQQSFLDLPPEQREVLTLKVFEGMTFREIAEATGLSANTAASRYRYGIDRLRKAMEGQDHG